MKEEAFVGPNRVIKYDGSHSHLDLMEIERLKYKNKKLREGLEFYADEGIYDRDYCIDLGDCTVVIVDDGKKARQILKDTKEGE